MVRPEMTIEELSKIELQCENCGSKWTHEELSDVLYDEGIMLHGSCVSFEFGVDAFFALTNPTVICDGAFYIFKCPKCQKENEK